MRKKQSYNMDLAALLALCNPMSSLLAKEEVNLH